MKPERARVRAIGVLILCCCVGACGSSSSSSATSKADAYRQEGKSIGLVLSNYDWMIYGHTQSSESCPAGFTHSNREEWEAQFPRRAQRQRQLDACEGNTQNRGPNCENVWFNPQAVRDPLPFREVKSRF